MISSTALIQLKAFARIDGLLLALVWTAGMALMFKQPESSWGALMLLSTPFFAAWRLRTFRESVLYGVISYRRALCFLCYVFFYASILFALAQMLYFKFLDNGAFVSVTENVLETMRPTYERNGISGEDLDLSISMLKLMTPVDISLIFFMYNLLIGFVLSGILAFIYKKTAKK